jgi:hypothetical protein
MPDAVKVAVIVAALSALILLASVFVILWHNSDSRNLGLALGTLTAGVVLLWTHAYFEFRGRVETVFIGPTYLLDRAVPSLRLAAPSPLRVRDFAVMNRPIVEQEVNALLGRDPHLLAGDRTRLVDQAALHGALSYLAASQLDWQINLQPFGTGGYTFNRVSAPKDCASFTLAQLNSQLVDAGNVLAPVGVQGDGNVDICLPPATSLHVRADSFTLENPFCRIDFAIGVKGTVLYVHPTSRSRENLPSGESRYEERPIGIRLTVSWSPWRAQSRDLPRYRAWVDRLTAGLREWFEGRAG